MSRLNRDTRGKEIIVYTTRLGAETFVVEVLAFNGSEAHVAIVQGHVDGRRGWVPGPRDGDRLTVRTDSLDRPRKARVG